jgi:hypothetical protein
MQIGSIFLAFDSFLERLGYLWPNKLAKRLNGMEKVSYFWQWAKATEALERCNSNCHLWFVIVI